MIATPRLRHCLAATGFALLAFTPVTQAATTQTRTSAFDYDPASRLLTKEVVEQGNSALCVGRPPCAAAPAGLPFPVRPLRVTSRPARPALPCAPSP